jgi:hypothetical protein
MRLPFHHRFNRFESRALRLLGVALPALLVFGCANEPEIEPEPVPNNGDR